MTVYFSCSKTDGRKANEAVKWEKKKNKAGEVVGKVGRKMEGRQSLGERMEGRGASRVYSACRVSRRRRSRVEVGMSWEGQAEQAFGVPSDLFTVCKPVPFISKDSSPSERLSFPSCEFPHTQPHPVLLRRELPLKERAAVAGGGIAGKPPTAQHLGPECRDPSGREEGQYAPGTWCHSVRRGLAGYSAWGHKELDRAERLTPLHLTSTEQAQEFPGRAESEPSHRIPSNDQRPAHDTAEIKPPSVTT